MIYLEIKCKGYKEAVKLQEVLRETTEYIMTTLVSPSHDDFRVALQPIQIEDT